MTQENFNRRSVKLLRADVARKIAAGEVIDRPNAIVRELLDNAVDSGANRIKVEITSGGIEKIRVIDNGCGMSKEDLQNCAHPHATSKISDAEDLLHLTTLGFRGEALSSMAAVSRLEIKSGEWKMNASVTEDHILTPCTPVEGTIVQTAGLFENFPARRQFLKRPASEGVMCRGTFEEKVLPRPDISFTLEMDGEEKLNLPATDSLVSRFTQTMEFFENEDLFYEIGAISPDKTWSFRLVIGEPSVTRSTRKDIYIFVNGRKIQEYSLIQAIEYGATGYFPNGLHPVACLFVTMDPTLVDFNIHPAKREARFKDIAALHHAVSTTTKDFFKDYTVKNIMGKTEEETDKNTVFDFADTEGYHKPSPELKQSAFTESSHSGSGNYVNASKPASYAEVKRQSFNPSSINSLTGNDQDARSRFMSGMNGNNPAVSSILEQLNQEELSVAQDDFVTKTSIDTHNTLLKNSEEGIEENEISIEGRTTKPNYISEPQSNENDGSFHFTGSALGTFLIAEKNDILYIIDQHAAHERYLYNQLVETMGQKQELLVPYTITTDSVADDNYLEAIKDSLEKSGFTIKNCGNGKWEISSVPIRWKGTEADLAKDLLDRRINPGDMINAFAASTACRQAVMDGTVLDEKTAAQIARQALELPDPHCPHGRPVYTTITRKQLFTLVKRI